MKTVRMRVHEALATGRLKGDPSLQRKSVLVAVWFLGSFALLFSVHSVWLQIALCFSYGLAASAVGFNIFHDANHGAISSNTRINTAVGMAASAVLGPSRYLWSYKHHILHHRFTNIQGWDDDLETRGFLRISPQQAWKPRYRGQHLFVFALYAINAIEMVFVKDFVQYFTLRMNPDQRIPAMSKMEKVEFWAGKAIYFAVFLALPIALLPFWHVVAGFLIYQVTLGLSLALVFSMAHQVESAEFPAIAGASPTIAGEWAAHQMRTTVNFANSSPGWNWFSGGLNHQIEHHLFPSVSHTHYPAIRQIVRSTAREFELPYKQFDTYGEALTSHYRFLRKLSLKPAQ
ncbi:MAG TPA: acyl-CoA desaturase [Rhizomicrobium sp.]|nr:acyl-CoA desaturase [Rhizomicrobium sp.]